MASSSLLMSNWLCRDRLHALPFGCHVYHKVDRVDPDKKAAPEDHPRLSQKLWNSSWWKETRVPEAVELKYDAQVSRKQAWFMLLLSGCPHAAFILHSWESYREPRALLNPDFASLTIVLKPYDCMHACMLVAAISMATC